MLFDTENNFFKTTAVITTVAVFVQSVQIAFLSVFFALIPTPFDLALASQLDELREKYDTANPYDNYTGTELRDKVLDKEYKPTDRDYESEILKKYYSGPPPKSKSYDFTKYDDGRSFGEKYSDGLNIANNTASKTKFPETTNGNINLNYHTKGAFIPKKNKDGSYNFQPNPEESDKIEPLSFTETASAEAKHSDTNVKAADDYGNQDGFKKTASSELDFLSGGNTSNALAYQTLVDSFNDNPAPKIDPRDPVFKYGSGSIDDVKKGKGDWYKDCKNGIIEEEKTVHYPVWEEEICTGPNRENLSSCTITRESNFPVKVVEIDGNLHDRSITFVDDYTVKISVGRNYYDWLSDAGGNRCRVYTSKVVFSVDEGYNVVKATRSGIRVDDTLRIFVNGSEVASRAKHSGDNSNFYWSLIPESDPGMYLSRDRYQDVPMDYYLFKKHIQGTKNDKGSISCEHYGGSINGSSDITALLQDLPDRKIALEFLLGVTGLGAIYYEITLTFDKKIDTSSIVHQNPPGCADAIGWTKDNNPKTCSANNPICKKPYRKPGGFCKADNWTCIDSGTKGWDKSILKDLKPIYPGDNHNVCWKANADRYQCDPLEGNEYCFIDHGGSKICMSYEDIQKIPDKCEKHRSNPLCFEKKRECAEGWFDKPNNVCYMWEITYECDVGPTKTHKVRKEVNNCTGKLPCVAGDCDTGKDEESNDDFGKAAAYLDMLTHMNGDMDCKEPSDPNTCKIFGGDPKFCSWEVTGMGPNCCEKPDGVNIMDYIRLTNAMIKTEAYTKLPYYNDAAAYVKGGWSKVSGAAKAGFDKVWGSLSTEITSPIESLFGSNSSGNDAGVNGKIIH